MKIIAPNALTGITPAQSSRAVTRAAGWQPIFADSHSKHKYKGRQMQVDIVGRVNNLQLPLSQPFIPLFECLVNSIDSIEDSKIKNGRIDVHFDRDTSQASVAGTDDVAMASICDVTVIDNGVGFDDANVRAFFMSDSTRKANRGNKGIGRFTWLKVFEKANI